MHKAASGGLFPVGFYGSLLGTIRNGRLPVSKEIVPVLIPRPESQRNGPSRGGRAILGANDARAARAVRLQPITFRPQPPISIAHCPNLSARVSELGQHPLVRFALAPPLLYR
jgi:hypothetical protein